MSACLVNVHPLAYATLACVGPWLNQKCFQSTLIDGKLEEEVWLHHTACIVLQHSSIFSNYCPLHLRPAATLIGCAPNNFVAANAGAHLGELQSLADLASPRLMGVMALLGIAGELGSGS